MEVEDGGKHNYRETLQAEKLLRFWIIWNA